MPTKWRSYHERRLCGVMSLCLHSRVDSTDHPLVLSLTEKHDRDVLGQIVVPLSAVDDCPADPLRVPLQPAARGPDTVGRCFTYLS